MKISDYRKLLERSLTHKRRILAVGPPGVGKTFTNAEVCRDLDWDLIVMCLPLDDPSTIRGYPRPPLEPDGDAFHCLFDGMARAFRATKPTLLFLDDIGQASESTLKAVMRVVQFGELDGKKLPDCVVIGGATNNVGHGAGVYGMIEPLKSRFHTIVNVETDLADVVAYGLSRDWPAWELAYLRNDPTALNDWKPCKNMEIDGACPRGWEYLAEWDKIGETSIEVWQGCVGKGRAVAAAAFKELSSELPDIDGILLDPDHSPVPENPGARYLVCMTLSSRMNAANFGTCLRYLNRVPPMFRAFSIHDAFRAEYQKAKDKKLPKDYKPLSSSRDFTAWTVSPDGRDILGSV